MVCEEGKRRRQQVRFRDGGSYHQRTIFQVLHSIWLFYLNNMLKNIFFSNFSADGIHVWGILLVIPLKFQEIKHQPFPMTSPLKKVRRIIWLDI